MQWHCMCDLYCPLFYLGALATIVSTYLLTTAAAAAAAATAASAGLHRHSRASSTISSHSQCLISLQLSSAVVGVYLQ